MAQGGERMDFEHRFDALHEVLTAGRNSEASRKEFGDLLIAALPLRPRAEVDHCIARALTEGWARPEMLAIPAIRQLAAKWPRALASLVAAGEPQMFGLLRDPLLLALLRSTPAATPNIDILLARLRQSALKLSAAGMEAAALGPTVAALAIRGALSGYALTLPASDRHRDDSAREEELVLDLGERLARGGLAGSVLSTAIATYCAYRMPEPKHLRHGLVVGDPVAALVEREVLRPHERRREISRALPAHTAIAEENAVLVAQYEAQPYPAWTLEPGHPIDLPAAVYAVLPQGRAGVRSVLVAGCGTGQHAIAAAHSWPNAEVLAIDLSRTSLAFAIDKRPAVLAGRVRFALADLLALDDAAQFDVIEAMGVLHHLADPPAGLAALRQRLAPGGLIGFAVYSARAREWIDPLKREYGTEARSDAEIRRFRAWALARGAPPELLFSPDFYSVGGCRDAIFHDREHRYDLKQIAAMIEAAGLRLIALQPPPDSHGISGPLPPLDDLAGWAELEERHPRLFLSMYELWTAAA